MGLLTSIAMHGLDNVQHLMSMAGIALRQKPCQSVHWLGDVRFALDLSIVVVRGLLGKQPHDCLHPLGICAVPEHMVSNSKLAQAYLEQRTRLLRFLVARGAGDSAEDLLQEVWLRLSGAADSAAAANPGYMMRVADRLMIDRYRSRRQEGAREQAWSETQPGLADGTDPEPDAERRIIARQHLERLERVLADIGDRPAAIFRRHRIDGIPQREIAEELGVSLSTVESDLRRAYRAVTAFRSGLDEV